MRLTQLKLSGFKSFVDPTVVPFSSQLVAVVGPNGCGKSNIIDAVRWVMGEGSAKTLRGESMTDVIFNGSSDRKPVGQASVELVFDNHLGRFAGQFSSYQEIAIKRIVTRDGDSGYFLNGTRCRKRDITDLFLGTGAGTRGYSIIGQNTISQIVEAKPEELRAYLEEAAGVSKYKERRRESMQRIGQTRENLERVKDICGELESQLNRLERQANVAERYKSLKQKERQYKGEILALKWQRLTAEQAEQHLELSRLSSIHEAHQAEITRFTKTIALLDSQILDTQQVLDTIQAQYYQLGKEVVRLQEAQQQQLREKHQLDIERTQMRSDIQNAETQLAEDIGVYQVCQADLNEVLLRLGALKETFLQYSQRLEDKQTQATILNQQYQAQQTRTNQYQRDVQLQTLNQQHRAARQQELVLRLEKIQAERAHYPQTDNEAVLTALREQQQQEEQVCQQLLSQHQVLVAAGDTLSTQVRELEQQLRVAQDKAQRLSVEHAALAASLQATFQKMPVDVSKIQQSSQRLVELIEVNEDWRLAIEWALGDALQAAVADSLNDILPSLTASVGQSMTWVTAITAKTTEGARPRLSDKIQGVKPVWLFSLDLIFAANSLEEAAAWLPTLSDTQSIMTADGVWLGQGWLRVADFKQLDKTSLVLKQKVLIELKETLATAEAQIYVQKKRREELYAQREENEGAQQLLRQALAESQKNLDEINRTYLQKKQAIEQALLHINRLQTEYDELQMDLEDIAAEQIKINDALTLALQQSEDTERQREDLALEKAAADEALHSCRIQVDEAKSALHAAELQHHREQLKSQQLQETIEREQARLLQLRERFDRLDSRARVLDKPDETAKVALLQAMERHLQLETELAEIRQQLDALQDQSRVAHQSKTTVMQKDNLMQEHIVSCKLAEQLLKTKADSLLESLKESDMDLDTYLSQCAEPTSIEMREQQLQEISDKIKRLGAINLMAIEEYQTELARKTHLDEQSQDLHDALATLEAAIAKMDEETRVRFEETFTAVNTLFQALFPRLFGGGRARLQLTCDNLLEAGILVMAEPPGKRNSTIQLLSGGEKAMTAVALVFAIFQLNPSPFCMLDEVDAPLDDLNVGRFCDLVKEMSQYVQFLLITHNKVTMELAEHLIGVTMREPGVSRIVAVDVAQAISA
jgi:chromosome segregation protein